MALIRDSAALGLINGSAHEYLDHLQTPDFSAISAMDHLRAALAARICIPTIMDTRIGLLRLTVISLC